MNLDLLDDSSIDYKHALINSLIEKHELIYIYIYNKKLQAYLLSPIKYKSKSYLPTN